MLTGGATIRARATQNLSAFWTRVGGELTVTPANGIVNGSRFKLVVTYDGIPETIQDLFGASGFFHTDDGALVIGQPHVASYWFPANDHPLDKSAFTFEITAPTGLEVLANGVLNQPKDRGDGWTTWTWDAVEPMAPYLAMMAIGEYAVEEYTENDLLAWDAIDVALPPDMFEIADGSLGLQGEMLDFLSDSFGRYPFSTFGGIVDSEPRLMFALETQTRPIYAAGFFVNELLGQLGVVHELAHQWVGDSLAVAGWQHIWLNEGFATYASWLWFEEEGVVTAQEQFDGLATIPASDAFWSLTIGGPGPDHLFDGAVYDRGAMTLHALRLEVGDEAFFRILRRWYHENRGGNVTTDQFIALAEAVYGQQLDDLFQPWLFTPSKPPGIEPVAAAAAMATTAPLDFDHRPRM